MISPSRALGAKKGDHQSRVELLAELLKGIDEKVFMVRHGRDRASTFVVCVLHTPELEAALEATTGESPHVLKFGKRTLLPLQLDKSVVVGHISPKLYNPTNHRWTSTIAVYRYR